MSPALIDGRKILPTHARKKRGNKIEPQNNASIRGTLCHGNWSCLDDVAGKRKRLADFMLLNVQEVFSGTSEQHNRALRFFRGELF